MTTNPKPVRAALDEQWEDYRKMRWPDRDEEWSRHWKEVAIEFTAAALSREAEPASETQRERIARAMGLIRKTLTSNADGTSTIRNGDLSYALNEIELAIRPARREAEPAGVPLNRDKLRERIKNDPDLDIEVYHPSGDNELRALVEKWDKEIERSLKMGANAWKREQLSQCRNELAALASRGKR